jgi:hypothetical protein
VRLALKLACLLSCSLLAQQPPKTMTKMVVQLQGSDVPDDSFAAKPKTIFRAGNKYCRIEEKPDPEHGIHGVIIVNEPETWMVNLADGTAKHMTDPGPTFNCRLPIFAGWLSELPGDAAKQIGGLEFGHEMEFFTAGGAKPDKGPELQSQQTNTYMLSFGDISLALFTYGTPERPLAVALRRGNKHQILWYSGYGEIEFDAKLFDKPSGVKIEEMKQ